MATQIIIEQLNLSFPDLAEPFKIVDAKGNVFKITLTERGGFEITSESGTRQVQVGSSTPMYSRNKIVAYDNRAFGFVDKVIIK